MWVGAGEFEPRHKFRNTFTAKFYHVLWLTEHSYQQNAINKGKLLEKTGRAANTCHWIKKKL
jgi:hypothetical protein